MAEKNIYQRISAVMQDVQYLCKDDQIKFGNTKYKAISEEKVTATVRESLIKNGIAIVPVKQLHRRDGTLTSVDVEYRIQNIDVPEDFVIAASSGTGADTQDKGVGKAMTYAYKYLLLRTFAIPTGEDPDKISNAELDEKQEDTPKNAPIWCPICGKEVKDVKKDGRTVTAKEVYTSCGGMCIACYKSLKAKEGHSAN